MICCEECGDPIMADRDDDGLCEGCSEWVEKVRQNLTDCHGSTKVKV